MGSLYVFVESRHISVMILGRGDSPYADSLPYVWGGQGWLLVFWSSRNETCSGPSFAAELGWLGALFPAGVVCRSEKGRSASSSCLPLAYPPALPGQLGAVCLLKVGKGDSRGLVEEQIGC